MKIIKGCSVFILSLLLFILLTIFVTLLNVRSTLTSARVPEKYIDQVDITSLAAKAIEQGIFADNSEGEEEDTNQINRELLAGIDESDELAIKALLKTNLERIFEYLTDPNQENLELNIAGLRALLVDTIVESPKTLEELQFPFDLCAPGQNEGCISQGEFATFLDKLFTGNVTEADIVEIIPRCPTGTSERQAQRLGCITQKQLDELELDKAQEVFTPDDESFGGIKDTYVVPQGDLENIQDLRDAIRISRLGLMVGFIALILISLLIVLLARKGAAKIFITILLLVMLVQGILFGMLSFLENKVKEQMNIQVEQAFLRDEAFVLFDLYKQQLISNLLITVGIMLILVIILFAIIILLNRKTLESAK